ncbi:probable cytochrome c biosynthesis protein [Lycium ferocissimum]|uniref:probable cytochrome c biosynthesis protein n=1 Tax=Lycium ferocissimum TaxID=112874 RepID=UPI0028169400|nr:probable cytochrome c biosynthesis protein [Lycium ferocissimum]
MISVASCLTIKAKASYQTSSRVNLVAVTGIKENSMRIEKGAANKYPKGALVDMGREQAERIIRNGNKGTTNLPLCWTAGTEKSVSDQNQEPIGI